jgi:hypothetical protein
VLGEYKLPWSPSTGVASHVRLVFGEPAGKVLGLTNVELATRLADKDVDSEHKKEEAGSPSWIRTNNLAVNSRPLYR